MQQVLLNLTSGKTWNFIRTLHVLYLLGLSLFIVYYFTEYKALKKHTICSEEAANATLQSKVEDPYPFYQQIYHLCFSK